MPCLTSAATLARSTWLESSPPVMVAGPAAPSWCGSRFIAAYQAPPGTRLVTVPIGDKLRRGRPRRQTSSFLATGHFAIHPPYAPVQVPVEKGIDVQIAVAVAENILTRACDVAILFTHDTDLVPVVEMIARVKGPQHIETASWASHSFNQRLREIAGVCHHRASGAVFQRIETPVNYAHKAT